MLEFAFVFSQVHVDFRRAELESVCALYGIQCNIASLSTDHERHVFLVHFPSVECVAKILSRTVLVKFAIELFAVSVDYDGLCAAIRAKRQQLARVRSFLANSSIVPSEWAFLPSLLLDFWLNTWNEK
ncbi:unnamed protein product [Gongylonema pulchrum]|uniref:RRM domain-containing protein n=1 Tax=Gongylonema pulchrum TaxID=637853 RepID=A0A183D2R2_9BILA|nr:unnamed protein product [Gongylonema pulchrum]